MVVSKDNFPEIISSPDWMCTWLIRSVFAFIFGLLMVLFYTLPVLFYIDGTIDENTIIAFMLIYYPSIIWLTVFIIRYLRRIKGNSVQRIWVNEKGVFYEKINGTVTSLHYDQLESSQPPVIYDVFPKTFRKGPTVLRVFVGGKEQTVSFENTDVAYSYYTGNHRELRSLFIQGIQLFRPDLRIAPYVYSSFYINPKTFEFDKKEYRKTIIIVLVFMILIFLGIEWYVHNRYGWSLLF